MQKHSFSLVFIIPFFSLISGCSNSSSSSGPLLTGSMTGLVSLYDTAGNISADVSGVAVSIEGTSFSTMTDSMGKWTIDDLKTGTYTVTYSKSGYGMMEQQGVQFVGGGPDYLGTVIMSEPPTFSVGINPIVSVSDSFQMGISYSTNINFNAYVLIALGTDQNVSASDPTKYKYASYFSAYGNSNGSNYASIPASALRAAGFASGTKAYIVAYPLVEDYGGFSNYIDIATGRTVYTSLGTPSNVIQLTVF